MTSSILNSLSIRVLNYVGASKNSLHFGLSILNSLGLKIEWIYQLYFADVDFVADDVFIQAKSNSKRKTSDLDGFLYHLSIKETI